MNDTPDAKTGGIAGEDAKDKLDGNTGGPPGINPVKDKIASRRRKTQAAYCKGATKAALVARPVCEGRR